MRIGNGSGTTPMNANWVLSLRCPNCHNRGTFDKVLEHDARFSDGSFVGIRRCPGPECNAHIYFYRLYDGTLITFPPERIDFDPTNIPAPVLKAIEEAITCYASQCYIAAAIMVRKTLEELCHELGATGANLKERLKGLSARVILPPELLGGLDDLRLLGNDAAHIESQEFNVIGNKEVEIGIEFAKEILKAVYQYSALLKKLKSFKKTP